jgi:hypothetical protein
MTPQALDDLDDEMFAALIRVMQREADAVRAANAKLPKG